MSEHLPILVIFIILIVMVVTIVRIIIRGTLSTKSGSMTSTVLGANDLMYSKDQKASMEIIMESKENKKMNEFENGEEK